MYYLHTMINTISNKFEYDYSYIIYDKLLKLITIDQSYHLHEIRDIIKDNFFTLSEKMPESDFKIIVRRLLDVGYKLK